jgi:large subunit ribosomal protein L1
LCKSQYSRDRQSFSQHPFEEKSEITFAKIYKVIFPILKSQKPAQHCFGRSGKPMMENEKIIEAIQELRKTAKPRNFVQSFDLAINLRNLDLRKPENRIKGEVELPHQPKKRKICVIADNLIPEIKKLNDPEVSLLRKEDIEGIGKREAKKLAKRYDFFLCEAPLMPLVGRFLGPALGPRNKMPKPMPPTANPKPFIEMAKRTVRFAVKNSPVVHELVGNEKMKDEEVAENILAVYEKVKSLLPKGESQIKDAYLKLTMSKAVKLW